MKTNKLNTFVLLILFCVSFTTCDTDIDKMYAKPAGEATAPVLSSEGFVDIVIDESNIDFTPVVLKWSKSDFGKDVLVEYSLEMATNASFEDSYLVTVGNNIYSKALGSSDLSKWVIANFNGLDENEMPVRVNLLMRIQATIAQENPTVTVPPGKVYSNTISMSVVPHNVPDAYPAEMYMIGVDFGNWNWASDGVAEMIPVHGFEGNFWCVRYITAGNGFKWCAKREWSGDFFSLGEDIGFYTEDNNAFVREDGMYMVFIDMANSRISVEPAKVYGIGDCFGGWNTAAYPFETDGNTMKITTAASGEVRMYAASDIAPVGGDWWRMEFVPINGTIVYRGTGDDQERIPVNAGKSVVLDFNAGTGVIK